MKRPLSNLLSLVGSDLATRLLGFMITVYLARVLQAEAFGIVSLGLAVLGYVQLLGSLGIPVLETRNVAANAGVDTRRVNTVLTLRSIVALILLAVTAAVVQLAVADEVTRRAIVLFSFSALPLAATLDWFFQGKERFIVVGLSRLAQFGVYGVVVVLAVGSAIDIDWVAVGFVGGTLAGTLVLLVAYGRAWEWPLPRVSRAHWRELLRAGLPLGVAAVLAQSAVNFPPLAVGFFAGARDVGMLSAAMKLVLVLLLADRLLHALLLPALSRRFSSDRGGAETLVQLSLKVVALTALPVIVAGTAAAGEVVRLVFGPGYEEAAPLLAILLWYFGFTLVNTVYVNALIAAGLEGAYTANIVWGSVVLLAGAAAGMVLLGTAGVAAAVAVAELVTVVLMRRAAAGHYRVKMPGQVWRTILAAGVMAVVALLLQGSGVVVALLVSGAAFTIAAALLRCLTADDVRYLRERFV